MNNIPCNVSFDCVCWKNRPAFRTLCRPLFNWSGTNQCPSIFSILCTFICSRFVNKDQLSGIPFPQTIDPPTSKPFISL